MADDQDDILNRYYGDGPTTAEDRRWLTNPESIEHKSYKPIDPYWVAPYAPSSTGELKATPPHYPGQGDPFIRAQTENIGPNATALGAYGVGQSLGSLYDSVKGGDWGSAAETAIPLALGAVMPVGPRGSRMRAKSLEQYVDELKQPRDGASPLLNYDKYLEPQPIPESLAKFQSQEPNYARQEPPQNVKNLQHYRTMDSLREKRDAGMYEGLEGYPVNPWYWPGPVHDAFTKELGPELGTDQFKKFLGFNAATSMQTAVPRNIVEAWMLYHHDLNDVPFNKLSPAELTGAAYNNKVMLGGDVAEGRGLTRPSAPKVRNYWANLQGAGTQPQYELTGEGYKPITQPVTLDSIMAQAMRYRDKHGEDRERFVGAPYRQGVDTINKLADEVGAAPADTQAGIWQSHQFDKHGDPVYGDPYARIFDDVANRIAKQEGEDPQRVLSELIHGQRMPPNFWYTPEQKADGGDVDGDHPSLMADDADQMLSGQMAARPIAYPKGSRPSQGGPDMFWERLHAAAQNDLGITPENHDLSVRDATIPASWLDAMGLEPSKNTGNTLLGDFGRKALTAVPGLSPGMDAYDAFQHGDISGGVKNTALAGAELAGPFLLGKFAGELPTLRYSRGYGVLRGDTLGASLADGVTPWTAPAKFGIRPSQEILAERGALGGAEPAPISARWEPQYYSRRSIDYDGPRDPTARVSLSANARAPDGNAFAYGIYKDGRLIGEAFGHVSGEKANIDWIGGHTRGGGPNSIGVSGVNALREGIREDYPAAKIFTGRRSTGARNGPAASEDANKRQTVRLDQWAFPAAGAGLGAGALLDHEYGDQGYAEGGSVDDNQVSAPTFDFGRDVGGAAAMLDRFPGMNMLSTAAGLVNSAIPGQPFGDITQSRDAAIDKFQQAHPQLTKAWGEMSEYPGSGAVFIGPAGARRLAEAKLRHADEWGGINRLEAAKQQWQAGDKANMSQPEIWKEHGWTPADTWGVYSGAPYKGEPASWLAMPGLRIDESRFEPMTVNGSHRIQRAEGSLPELVHGLDEALVAEPNLRGMTTRFDIDPRSQFGTGSAAGSWEYPDGIKRIDTVPIGLRPTMLRGSGINMDELEETLPHELNHAMSYGQRLAPTSGVAQGMEALRDTKAEALLRHEVEDLGAKYDQMVQSHGPDNFDTKVVWRALSDATDKLARVGGAAHYLNEPQERAAREAYLRHRVLGGDPAAHVPGDVDTYVPGAMGWRLERAMGAPLKAYDPRTIAPSLSDIDEAEQYAIDAMFERAAQAKRQKAKADGGPVDDLDAPSAEDVLDRHYAGQRPAELKSYDFPWYRRLGHAATDYWYGDNATPQQNDWIQKFTGPENPFNFPAQISHGAENAMTGWRQGDPVLAGAGALEAGLASVLPGFAGYRMAARPFEAYAANRAAKTAAEAASGPWGNPGMLDELLDRPQTARHELNEPASQPKPRDRSSKELNAEYNALRDEGFKFLEPQQHDVIGDISMGPDGQYYGETQARGPQGRWWYADNPTENFDKATSATRFYYPEGSNKPATPLQGLAKDVLRHGANNENIPGFYDKAEALAQRLQSLEASQKPERNAVWQQMRNWDDTTGFGYNRNLFENVQKNNPGVKAPKKIGNYSPDGYRYIDDADKFFAGREAPYINDGGDNDALRRILTDEFGANPKDPASIDRAYQAFWADENARKAAGKPTRHDEEVARSKWEQDNDVRTRYGLDPETTPQEVIDAAYERDIAGMKDRIANIKAGLGGGQSQRPSWLSRTGNNILRYGPPTVVGSYAADKLGQMIPPAPKIPEQRQAPSKGVTPVDAPSTSVGKTIQTQLDNANWDRNMANTRMGIHGLFGPAMTAGVPGLFKVPVGLAQMYFMADAYKDRQNALDRQQTWEAQRHGYLDKLPELDKETVLD